MADDERKDAGSGANPAADPEPAADDDELAGLSTEARAIVERANSEAATRRRELKTERDARVKAERELAELRKDQESELERQIREAEQRGFDKAAPILLEAELAIAAAGKMRDPRLAARLVPEQAREAILEAKDSDERAARAETAIEELLEAHPYMAAEQQNGPAASPRSLVTQGARTQKPGAGATTPDEWLRTRGGRS